VLPPKSRRNFSRLDPELTLENRGSVARVTLEEDSSWTFFPSCPAPN
jgi:hypothetical protein